MIVDETISNLRAYLEQERLKSPELDAHLGGPPLPANPELDAAIAAANISVYAPTDGQIDLLALAAWLPPVVGSPLWFLEEVAEAYGQGRTDYLVDELCGLKVVQRAELSEPVLILADGKTYTIVPEWARRTAEQIASEDARRRLGAVVGVS